MSPKEDTAMKIESIRKAYNQGPYFRNEAVQAIRAASGMSTAEAIAYLDDCVDPSPMLAQEGVAKSNILFFR